MLKREKTGKIGLFVGKALAVASVLLIVLSTLFFNTPGQQRVKAATSDNLNFQARLMNAAGNIVDDGYYNIEFKLYDASSGGTLLWTETYYDSNGVTAGNDNRLRVKNGYISANLGSLTAFPNTINWDQQLWITMNVGGTTQTATPTYDGEMSPRLKLTAVPYAFRAEKALGVASNNTSTASTNSNGVTITTGNATGLTSNSGSITLDVGTATQTAGTISIGTANTSGITIGRTGVTTTNSGALTVTQTATFSGTLAANGTSNTIGDATTDRLTVTAQISGASPLVFQGVTDNGFATTFAITDPTANNTITFPDASGTVQLAPASGNYLFQVPTTTAANTVTPTANSVVGLTVNGTSGTAATAAIFNQSQAADGVNINTTNGSGTQTNGLLVARNGAGTTTNLLNLTNTSGTATNALTFTGTFTKLINSTNFNVTNAGAVTAVGVNAGAGLLQGALGLTVTGAAVSLNDSSNFATNINTGTSTGAVSIGNSAAGAIAVQSASTIGLTGTTSITGLGSGSASALTVTGTVSATSGDLNVVHDGNGASGIVVSNYHTPGTNDGAIITLRHADGSLASPTITGSGRIVSTVDFQGYDGANFKDAASITAAIDATSGTNDMPGRLMFNTTPDGTSTPVERLRIDNAGNIYVGNGVTNASPVIGSLQATGSSTAGTAPGVFTIKGGAGTTTTTGSNGGALTLQGGDAGGSGGSRNGGALTLDGGAAAGGVGGTISIGTSNTSGITIGRTGVVTTFNSAQLTNNGSTLNTSFAIADKPAGGNIGTAAATVDIYTTFDINQTTTSQTLTLPNPTTTTSGRMVYVNNVGSASFTMYGSVISAGKSNAFIWNGTNWVTTVSLSGSVVNAIGTIDSQTKSADGAVISTSALYLQTADASFPGLVSTGTQTFAGGKTFNGLITGVLGATVSGATINLNASSNFATNINTGTSTGAVSIGNSAAGAIALQSGTSIGLTGITNINASANNATNINTGTSTGAISLGNANAGAITLQSGSLITAKDNSGNTILNIDTANGNNNVGINTATEIFTGSGAALNVSKTGGNSGRSTIAVYGSSNSASGINGIKSKVESTAATGALYLNGFTSGAVNSGSGTVTDSRNFYSISPSVTGGGLITNQYGIYIDQQDIGAGVTNGYGVYQAATQDSNYFAGATTVASLLTGQAGLTVTGAAVNLNASSNFATNINTGTSTGAVSIGNNTGNTALTLDSGTATIAIGTGAQARTVNIGTGAAAQTVTLGSTDTTSTTTVNGGSGGIAFNTAGTARGIFDSSNNLFLGNASVSGTAATPNNFIVQGTGSATAGTAGATFTVKGGAGAATTTGSAGGAVALRGGDAGGSGNNNGGAVTIQGGSSVNTATGGSVTIQGGTGVTGGSVAIDAGANVGGLGNITIGNNYAGAVSICNSTSCDTINIGTNADADTISVGDSNDTVGINGTTTITGTTAVNGITNINVGANNATNINTGTSTGAVSIGNNTGNTAITIDSGTSAISIGTGAQARTVNIGTGAAAQTVTLGSTNTTSATTINAGSNGINIQTGTNGDIAVQTGTGGSLSLLADNSLNIGITSVNGITVGRTDIDVPIAVRGATTFSNVTTSSTALVVKGAASQTADLFQAQDSTGAVLARISSAGVIGSTDTATASTNSANTIIRTGNATGLTSNSGNLTLDVGTATGTTGTISIGTTSASAISVGNGTGTFALNSNTLDISSGGAISGATGLSLASGNFSQSGSGTFATGTGAISLNGDTTIAAGKNFLTTKGTDYSTTGTTNNVALAGALIRLTGASAQTITGISAGTAASDGRRLTLVNNAGQAATLSNNSGSSSAGNQIITGTGSDLTIPAGGAVELIYDWNGAAASSYWRVTGAAAVTGGFANQQLSNLSGTVAVNLALNPGTDNTLDLGSTANSWRTLYADTSVLTAAVDYIGGGSGTLSVGTTNATQVDICNTANCDTINIGANADADTITVGDANDTTNIKGTVSINASTNAATNINTGTSTGAVSIGNSAAGAIALQSGTSVGIIGVTNINASANNATNINTGTSTGLVSIGGGSGTFALNTTNIDISSAGAISGVTGYDQTSGNLNYTTSGASNATFTSSLASGARSASALTVTQANDATNDNSAALVQFTNSDTASTAAVLSVTQSASNLLAPGININSGAASIGLNVIGVTSGNGVIANTITSGNSFSGGGALTTGNVYYANIPSTITSGSAFSATGTVSGSLPAFTGNLINIAPDRTLTGTSINDTGRSLSIARTNTVNSAAQTFTISGDVANLSSNCTQTSGTCTDTSNILELQQNYANASGAVLNVGGAGTGNLATLDATNASANGVLIDVQSSSSSQYGLKVTSNNGAITSFQVNGDGSISQGVAGTTTTINGAATVTQTLTTNGTTAFNGTSNTIGDATTDRLTVTAQILGGSPLVFQGTTDNGFATTFAFTDPTANNTITFPDASGTVLLSAAGAGGAIVQVPGSTAINTITPTAASTVGLTVNATSNATGGVAAIFNQANNTVTADTIQVNTTNTSGTQTNGALIARNGAGGTTTNLLNLTNTAGTATNALTFTGTFTKLINSTNFNVTNAGAVTAVGVDSGSGLLQGTGGLTLTGTTQINASGTANTTIGNTSNANNTVTIQGGSTGGINIGTAASSVPITIGNSTGGTITIGQSSGSDLVLNDAQWSITGAGVITTTGNINANSGTIATNQATANLLNATATTVNAFGAASAINIGAAAGSTINLGGAAGTSGGTQTIQSINQAAASTNSADLVIATGNAAGATSNSGSISINVGTATQTTGSISIGTAARTQNVTIGNSTGGATRVGQNGGTLQLDGTNFDVSTAGVVTLAGGQTQDINTAVSGGAGTALVIQPGTSTGASSNGAATTIKGGDGSGTTSVTGGALTLQGGSATGASGTRNGGNVSIQAGSGATANGSISIGTSTTTGVTIGSNGAAGNTIDIDAGTGASAIEIGNTTTAHGIQIGSNATGDNDILLGGANAGSTVTIEGGTAASAIQIGNGATAHGIQIGTGAAVQTIVLGSTNSTSATTINAGTGNLNIGNDSVAKTTTINIGADSTGADLVAIGSANASSTFTAESGTGTTSLFNGATAHTINMATGAAVQTITIGSTNSTSALTLQAGTGTIGIGNDSVAKTTTIAIGANSTGADLVSIGSANASSTLTLEAGTAAGAILIGNGTTAHGIKIGSDATGDNDILLGGANAGSTVTIEGGTAASAIQIGNGATAHGIQIGSGAGVNTIVLGSTNTTSATTINSGTGTLAIGNDSVAKTTTISIGAEATGADVISIGSANASSTFTAESGTGTTSLFNGATAHTINMATGAAVQTITIGSTNSTSALTLQAGTGTIGIGNDSVAKTTTIAIGANSTGADLVSIGSANASSTLTLEAGTAAGSLAIGNGATAHNIQIGTGAAAQTVTLGSTNTTSTTTLQAGSGGIVLSGTVTGAVTDTLLCKNGSNQISTCGGSALSTTAFLQNGNSFGAGAVLGTNDANSLSFETQNITQATIAVGGATTFQNSTNSANGFTVKESGGSTLLNIDTTNKVASWTGNAAATGAYLGSDPTFSIWGTATNAASNPAGLFVLNAPAPTAAATTKTYIGAHVVSWTDGANISNGYTYGGWFLGTNNTSGNMHDVMGLTTYAVQTGAGTVTDLVGLNVSNNTAGNSTNNYGIKVASQTGGTNTYGIAIGAADTQTLWVCSDVSSTVCNSAPAANGGIAFGSSRDTNLYRSAANTLKTDDNFLVQTATNSTNALTVANDVGTTLLNVDTSSTNSNLITNGGFEQNTTGWAVKGAASIARSTTNPWEGAGRLDITTTAASGDGVKYNYALAATTTYTLSMHVSNDQVLSGTYEIGYSGDGSTDTSCYSSQWLVTARYDTITCSFTTGAVSGTRYVYFKQTSAQAKHVYIDAVRLEAGSSVSPYQNGTLSLNGVITNPVTIRTAGIGSQDALTVWGTQGNKPVFAVNSDQADIQLTNTVGSGITTFTMNQYSNDVLGSYTVAKKYRGTSTSPSAVQNGDGVYAVLGYGYDGSNVINGAAFGLAVDGAVSAGVVPMSFGVSTGSSAGGTVRLNISSAGATTVTGASSGAVDALTVTNSTSTGNIFVAKDNATAVFTIADGGAVSTTADVTVGTKLQVGAAGDVGTIAQCDTASGLVTGTCGLENVVQSVETTNVTNGQNFLTLITPSGASNTSQNAGVSSSLALQGTRSFTNNNYSVAGFGYNLTTAGTVNQLAGALGYVGQMGAGSTVTDLIGVKAGIFQTAGTVTNGYGINVVSSSGTIGTNYGIKVDPQTAGTADYGVAIGATDTTAGNVTLWVSNNTDSTDKSGGITFGSSKDTNVYRSAADTLKTDDSFVAVGNSAVGSGATVDGTGPVNSYLQDSIGVGTYASTLSIQDTFTGTAATYNNGQTIKAVANFSGAATSFMGSEVTSATASGNAQNFTVMAGGYNALIHRGTGTITAAYGTASSISNKSSGTITEARALYGVVENTSTGTITTAVGARVGTALNSGGGTITTNYGLIVDPQTVGAADYGVAIGATDTTAGNVTLWVANDTNSTDKSGGITFGSSKDTNLYRAGAGILQTDGDLYFLKETAHNIRVASSTTATANGGALSMYAGTGNTTGTGGAMWLQGGAGGASGNGGATTLKGGDAGGGNTIGGYLYLYGGASSGTGTGSAIVMAAGNGGGGNANGGAVGISAGDATASTTGGTGGALTINSGNAAGTGALNGGALTISSGNGSATGTGSGGLLTIQGGNGGGGASGVGGAVTIKGGIGGATSGAGGLLTLQGGNATAGTSAGGGVTLVGGTAVGATNGGNVSITGGTAAATAGSTGGTVTIAGGAGTSTGTGAAGSAVAINGGAAGGSGANAGGAITLTGGTSTSTGSGGAINLQGGAASATAGSTGGAVSIVAGAGSSTGTGAAGANVTINSGAGAGSNANAGGTITVQAGAGSATGTGGAVTVQGGNGGATSGVGGALTLQGGTGGPSSLGGAVNITGGTSGSGSTGGAVTITGGTGLAGGAVNILGGSFGNTSAALNIGTVGSSTKSSTINISNTSDGTSIQTISIGSTANASNAVTLSAGSSGFVNLNATQAQFTEVTGTRTLTAQTRTSNVAGTNVTISAGTAGSGASAFSGGTLTLQGGAAGGTGNANGGSVTISGGAAVGTGTQGLVNLSTSAFTSASEQSFSSNTSITAGNVDAYSSLPVKAITNTGLVLTVPDPAQTGAIGRILYIAARSGSLDFTLRLNSSRTAIDITMKANTTATLIWNGTDWTAAGASSSTDLQAAYNNTLTSAGGAELVLAAPGGNADGLTVRNNATTAITGALLEVQTSAAGNLLSVNNNATEYASNGGSETAGASSTTFPSNTWSASATGGTQATVTRTVTSGEYATGQAAVKVVTTGATTANQGAADQIAVNGTNTALTSNLVYTVSFTTKGTSNFSTLDIVYSKDGTNTATTSCATGKTVTESVWTRITCTFTAPSSGITTSNAIFVRQSNSNSLAKTFYIDNLSVNTNASTTHAADGSVDSALGTNWTQFDGDGGAGTTTIARDTSTIYDTSGAVSDITTAHVNEGVRNNLAITPSVSTQYLVSFYAKLASGTFTDITVGFLPAGGNTVPVAAQQCKDYNTQTIVTTGWTKITCLVTTPSSGISDPDLVIYQPTATARTFYIDALSITLNTNTASNVQVGGANKGGPTTLFTLDRASSAPIADNNDAYLGSMYYDTTTGRIQCYEADGWGACGSAPDNIVNLNPEYAGAVLNGTGVGTMTSDFCGNGGGLSVNTSLCASGEARNYYSWTSPQATDQTYSVYVTYQLPATFKSFADDNTVQLTARRSSSSASVTYEMFKSQSGTITQCGTATTVTTSDNTWQTVGINGNESTGCSFGTSSASAFVIFKINVTAKSNASAYVGTLGFTTTGN